MWLTHSSSRNDKDNSGGVQSDAQKTKVRILEQLWKNSYFRAGDGGFRRFANDLLMLCTLIG